MQWNLRFSRHSPVILAAAVALLSVPVHTAPPGQASPGPRVQKASHRGRQVAAGEVLVKFRGPRGAGPAREEIRSLADTDRDEEIGRHGVRRLRSRTLDVARLLAALAGRQDVEYVEPNYIVRALDTVPADTHFGLLWNFKNTGQTTAGGQVGVAGADIGATRAWDITIGSRASVVAVIDSGIDYRHPDLQANVWTAPAPFSVTIGGTTIECGAGTHGFNAIALTCDPLDDNSHGTHVAGIVGAAGNNGVGVVGVNWVASVMGLKFLDANGEGTIADAINAIEFAIQAKQVFGIDANVRVLSASWGGDGFSQALLDQVTKADAHDMLFVAAAGNDGADNDAVAFYPANFTAPNVVAVAATDNRDQLWAFSNHGATRVALGAPGVSIASTVLNNGYAYKNGTSMAAPHVAGAAALVLSACSLDTAWVKTTLLSTVDPLPSLAGQTATGGRLNAFGALNGCVAAPAAPGDLAATLAGGQVSLTWTDNSSNEFGFRIERAVTGGAWTELAAVATPVTTFADGAVVPGTPYSYRVFAYNAAGNSATSSNTASVEQPLAVQSVVANRLSPVSTGTAITWTATATGGLPPLQYQFWRHESGVGWTLGQAYSTANTYTWTPEARDHGTYTVRVWVRSGGSTASYEAWLDSDTMVVSPSTVLVTGLSTTTASPAAPGTTITWTAAATGGAAPLHYQFWRYKSGAGWTLGQAYSTSNKYSWTPAPADAGVYMIQVWVRSDGSGAAYDAYLNSAPMTVKVAASRLVVTGLFASKPSPAAAGSPITWTATASGGIAPLEYQFWRYDAGAGWMLVRAYSTSRTYTWTPKPGDAGTHWVQVRVRSHGSTATAAWLTSAPMVVTFRRR